MQVIDVQRVGSFLGGVTDADETAPVAGASFLEIAEGWRGAGLRSGEVVLVCLPNGKMLLEHFFGVMLAGGVPALVGPGTPSARVRELVGVMGARAVVSLRPIGDLRFEISDLRIGGARVYWVSSDGAPAAKAGEVILLTSGTSGFASGCVHDFSALVLNARRHAESIGQKASDTVLVSLPLYFSFALVVQAMGSMVTGNRLVIGGPPFHVPSFVKSIERFGVTVSSLTPVLVGSLLRSGVEIPGRLRVLTVGGDALASATVEELIRLRPGGELYLTYGLTQAGPRVSTLAAHQEPAGRYGSVGLPLEGTGVRLEEVEGSGMKQLFVSSETVMKRRAGTHEGGVNCGNRIHRCEQPPPQPSPGVPGAGEEGVPGEGEERERREVATGDVFTRDDEGYLYFRGRMSDYIVRHGEKVCLAAVRRVAMGFANVVRATTPVSRHEYGEDFDLVLDVAGAEEDYHVMLRGWLKKSEMPREVRVVKRAMSEVGYK